MSESDPLRFFKKIYNTFYQSFSYAIGFSSAAGLGNGLENLRNQESFYHGFGEAYINNFPLSFAICLVYPLAFSQLKKSKHYRLYANLLFLTISSCMLANHYLTGTENPIQTIIPGLTIGSLMVNNQVSKDSLENKLNHPPQNTNH